MDKHQKFWERVARLYTPLQEKTNRELYDRVIDRCRPYIRPDSHVLELGCGTGQFTFPLCGGCASWLATDFSPRMVEEGTRLNRTKAHFAVADATNLPQADGTFDVVLMANVLHIMPDPEKALREIHRVLKKDGVLLAPTFVYQGKINRARLWVLERVGFKTFHKWTLREYGDFIAARDFALLEAEIIPGELLPEAFIAAKKADRAR